MEFQAQIRNAIAKAEIKKALELLSSNGFDEAILLSARFNRLQRQQIQDVISESDATREQNKIVYAILQAAGVDSTSSISKAPVKAMASFNDAALLQIIADNKRRRPDIAEKAKVVLGKFRDWEDTRITNPSFDINERRLNLIRNEANELITSLKTAKEDSLEATVDKIMAFLQEPIPTYESLKEAYKLAAGRGMADNYVVNQLNMRPVDSEVNITIAERIEDFVATIQKR